MSKGQDQIGCVITGVAGFVGSHLAERLLSLGYRVVGVDNFFSGYRRNMASFCEHPSFTFYERSILEPDLLPHLTRRHCHLIHFFHLAAIVSVPYSVEHHEETMEVNYRATLNFLREHEKLGFRTFVFAGSAAEYSNDERQPLKEEYADEGTEHLSPYGQTKFLASKAVASSHGGVALRCFNIFGPRQDPGSPYSGVISRFIDLATEGKGLTIFGDGEQTRDFVYVSDVVDAYLFGAGLGSRGSPAGAGIYNIGTGRSVSVLDLAKIVQELTRSSAPLRFMSERPGDIRHSWASIEAFHKATGWAPRISFREGLKKTLEWAAKRV